MFVYLEKGLSRQGAQSKHLMYEKPKQTENFYTNVWHMGLNTLNSLVVTSLAAPSTFAGAARDIPPTTEANTSGGRTGGYARGAFQY